MGATEIELAGAKANSGYAASSQQHTDNSLVAGTHNHWINWPLLGVWHVVQMGGDRKSCALRKFLLAATKNHLGDTRIMRNGRPFGMVVAAKTSNHHRIGPFPPMARQGTIIWCRLSGFPTNGHFVPLCGGTAQFLPCAAMATTTTALSGGRNSRHLFWTCPNFGVCCQGHTRKQRSNISGRASTPRHTPLGLTNCVLLGEGLTAGWAPTSREPTAPGCQKRPPIRWLPQKGHEVAEGAGWQEEENCGNRWRGLRACPCPPVGQGLCAQPNSSLFRPNGP